MKARKQKKPSFGVGWVTTDEDERNLRRYRAEMEPMTVRFVGDKSIAPFGDYDVISVEGRDKKSYRVELRSLTKLLNTCSCPDFRKSALGTCKHIERVLLRVKRKTKGLLESPCGEIFMSPDFKNVCFQRGDSMADGAAESLSRHFTAEGRLKIVSPLAVEALLTTCARLARKSPGVIRVSPAVSEFAKSLKQKEYLAATVGAFASEMASCDGKWPFLKTALYPYQVEGALHLATKGRAVLADEMGLGKTVQAIAAALLLREVAKIKRVLVVVPTSLKGEWAEQIAFFSDVETELLSGGRCERLARYVGTGSFFLIANYEQIMRDGTDAIDRFKPDLIILDEAQRIKNWNTKTARTFKKLRSRFAFVLTGTPLENRIDEFYSIAEFVDPSLFGSLFRFNRAYYRFDEKGKSAGMQNLDDLHEKAATIMLRRRKDMVEDELPGRTDKNYFVPMTKEQSLRYCEFEDKVARLCARAKKRPLTKDEMKLLQRHLACMRMLCDTCFILDDKIRVSPKIDEAMAVFEDIFSSDSSRKIVVFSEWVKMLDLLEERLKKEGVGFAVHTGSVRQDRRRDELKRFKTDPDCRVLLSSEAGGVGLNLQNASVVMNLDLPWNPAKLEQRIARAWRKKQSREVLVINLVSEGTIEQRMLGTLKFKQGLADMVLDARGDASDFESENSKSAFLARVSSLIESRRPAVARADGTAGTGLSEIGRGNGIAENASEKETSQKMRIDEVLTEETLMRLAELEKLGLVTLGEEAKKRLSLLNQGGETQSFKRQDRNLAMEKRLTVARSAMEKARRSVQMGDLLHGGGFEEESMKPYCEAASLAGAAILFLDEGKRRVGELVNDVPDDVSPLTNDEYPHIQRERMFSQDVIATLDYALNKGFIPNAEHRMRILMEECANLANGFGLRGIM